MTPLTRYTRSFNFLLNTNPQICEKTFGLILNIGLANKHNMSQILRLSGNIVCADGGANVLYKHFHDSKQNYVPLAIVGDLDSVDQTSRAYFENLRVPFVLEKDQNKNDFEKAFGYIIKEIKTRSISTPRIICTDSFKRYDHFL